MEILFWSCILLIDLIIGSFVMVNVFFNRKGYTFDISDPGDTLFFIFMSLMGWPLVLFLYLLEITIMPIIDFLFKNLIIKWVTWLGINNKK